MPLPSKKGDFFMSHFRQILSDEFQNSVFHTIAKEWMLITAEQQLDGKPVANTMTASWGGLGHLWNQDVAFTFIRPQRYTKQFVDNSEYFSLCFFGGDKMEELRYLGTASGRDEDKIARSGLTLTHIDGVPCFEEATAVLICRKLYVQTIKPECFVDSALCQSVYPKQDFHDLYIGGIEKILVR